ncbi:aldo/keto reductase [Rhodobacteraceae bacterium N5(2021)]|uniref:Aldo/keto reductase n=1 Tax=Gymnodinialimonas phycosphaerae TaxID=2841589 RepID=A0A975YFK0_9RHOB|nr:aldo/keto reductase [Gymnodinialimonas phycosphaerae]MBY4894866.1 aldo/keto reductase [Gymnodinialimonas phycosphaerae]
MSAPAGHRERRIVGQNVGPIGLGCMSFGGIYGATDEQESAACMQAALDLGVTHWDVAEVYGDGVSESVIGRFLAQTDAQVTLATKGGIYRTPERHFSNARDRLRASLEGSLKRLGRSSVELYYIHRRDHSIEVEAVMETMMGFRDEGLIGGIGFSEIAPFTLRRAATVGPVAAVQSEYSLWTRQPELGMIQTCAELGVAFVAFSPLARGMLSDRFPGREAFADGDFRKGSPRFSDPNYQANMAAIAGFKAWCAAKGWATSSVALAWVLAQGEHIVPIPGTRSAAHLAEWGAATEIDLSDADLAEIEGLLPVGFAHGARYGGASWPGIEIYG